MHEHEKDEKLCLIAQESILIEKLSFIFKKKIVINPYLGHPICDIENDHVKAFYFNFEGIEEKKQYEVLDILQYFSNLEFLELRTESISIPDSIGELISLKGLLIDASNLTNLPHSIIKLINLEKLVIEESNLNIIPQSIESLKKMKVLSINSKNQISDLHSLKNMHYVKKLYLNNKPYVF